MARIVAEITSPSPPRDSTGPFYDSRDTTPRSPTLGEILNFAGSVKNVSGEETPSDQVVDVGDTSNQPRAFPFVLSFSNLSYNVKIRNKLSWPTLVTERKTAAYISGETHFARRTKVLLDGISGEARDGEIMAVMGASGSGKSTLIDALANRIAKGRLKGSVKINGEELESRLMKIISAYVMQDDLLFPMLTVEETLMFAADFRLPRKFSKSKKKTRAQALIDQLGLRTAAKTIIGDEGHRGVSGGERRRVSIGIDIIHDPILLFLDEPTSGLDSSSAFMVVKVLQRIAQSGSIVIMSIHQPSYRILGLLDKMIFLSRGHTVYSGSPSNLPLFFADFGHPIPENENPAEFVLDLVLDLEGSPGGTKSLVEFNNSRRTRKNMDSTTFSADNLSLKQAISGSISRGKLVSGVASNETSSKSEVPIHANPFWIETAILSKRAFTNSSRMPELLAVRLGLVMVTGFLLATIYWQLDNSPKGIRERLGFLSYAIGTTFYICAEALPGFLQERYIFMRETAHNAYRISSYVLSHSLVVLPSLLCSSLAFSVTTFWAVGLDGGPSGFIFYFLTILASFWTGSSFITFLSGIVPHVILGYVIAISVSSYFLLFAGFYINRDRIPFYWIWFHYISLVKYPYEAVLQNEFGDPNKCFVKGVEIFDTTPLAGLPLLLKERLLRSSLGMNITDSTCITTGGDILKQQAITDLSKWNCLWITVAWGFLFRILFYFSLLLGSRNKRR